MKAEPCKLPHLDKRSFEMTSSSNLLKKVASEFSASKNSSNNETEDSFNFCVKNDPSDFSNNINHGGSGVTRIDSPWLPDKGDIGLFGCISSSTRDKFDEGKKLWPSAKDKQSDSCVPRFSYPSNYSYVNKKKQYFSSKEKALCDSVTRPITRKSHKERLKPIINDSDVDDEITVLHCDFPVSVKKINRPEKRNDILKMKQTFTITEKHGDNYVESTLSDHYSPTDVNLCDIPVKTETCEANALVPPDDPMLFCDIKSRKLRNTMNGEHCHGKFKEIMRKIDQVYIKDEPCDSIEDDGNDSGIHSPLPSELSNAAPKGEPCEPVIKKEPCEINQSLLIDEPWLPWLPLDTIEKDSILRQEPHEQLIKNEPLEADFLKQIKPNCVSKRKLANKYISMYNKPQLNEAGQTFNCSECAKSFTMRNLLSHHIIYEHNTLKLLKCPICYRRFNKLNGLSNHIRATHKIRRHHICKKCHRSFSRHHYLAYHMRAVHKIVK